MDLKRAEERGLGGKDVRNKVRWGSVLVEKVIRVSTHLEGNSSWG